MTTGTGTDLSRSNRTGPVGGLLLRAVNLSPGLEMDHFLMTRSVPDQVLLRSAQLDLMIPQPAPAFPIREGQGGASPQISEFLPKFFIILSAKFL